MRHCREPRPGNSLRMVQGKSASRSSANSRLDGGFLGEDPIDAYTNPAFNKNSSVAMPSGVAFRAECNKVLLGIIAGATAEFLVVNFQVRHHAA
jgi:hypothetical protein